ncbi:PTS mannose transporter subunit IIA [Enterococcus faecium]|uniref:PTS sugar transporter subunit IIA n=1 Tax=Enterococcus TaxID=1350 RepID=UPI0008A4C685|nr:PTS mannose transporter subunit IIA [Enterococcus sp. HMSC061C05]EGP4767617.1 PTS mannose transporter subunit IIA [Enterococcus faecium]EGP4864149.1 PTS mannose transporter subunit IIA [Enterococcus faecium]EGP5145280.1 PTS mannose transporter subunit IIA [Enterococcus faecium]EGP5249279.1 PTS mannose transporter subunit IIA [Enterococcus faecium]EGP5392538.1 PTS mannose transporter subunit IIA [Enterococcus faecium]
MDREIILASHGKFASGILDSLELIYGKNHSITALDCYTDENFDLTESVSQLFMRYKDKEIIVLTDLFGGSVNNEFLQYINQNHVYLVAGLNLPLLIELVSRLDAEVETTVLIQQVLTDSKKMIQFCNEQINQKIEEDEF